MQRDRLDAVAEHAENERWRDAFLGLVEILEDIGVGGAHGLR